MDLDSQHYFYAYYNEVRSITLGLYKSKTADDKEFLIPIVNSQWEKDSFINYMEACKDDYMQHMKKEVVILQSEIEKKDFLFDLEHKLENHKLNFFFDELKIDGHNAKIVKHKRTCFENESDKIVFDNNPRLYLKASDLIDIIYTNLESLIKYIKQYERNVQSTSNGDSIKKEKIKPSRGLIHKTMEWRANPKAKMDFYEILTHKNISIIKARNINDFYLAFNGEKIINIKKEPRIIWCETPTLLTYLLDVLDKKGFIKLNNYDKAIEAKKLFVLEDGSEMEKLYSLKNSYKQNKNGLPSNHDIIDNVINELIKLHPNTKPVTG
jgi:hypothetical protein